MMIKVIAPLLAAALFYVTPAMGKPLSNEVKSNPYELVKAVAQSTFDRFKSEQTLIQKDANHLKTIVQEEMMEYVDSKYTAYSILGNNELKKATKEQRQNFVEVFEQYLVITYAQAFTQFSDQEIAFDAPNNDFLRLKKVNVGVTVLEKGRPPIELKFKLRRLKDKTWKAYDLVAEGVSLLSSKQSEIQPLLRKQGIDSVAKMLSDKAKQDVKRDPK